MSIETGLFQLIQTNVGIADLVDMSAGDGLYWILAPKSKQKSVNIPFIVLSWVATSDTIAMAGDAGFRNALLQIDCYGSTYYESKAVADAVRALLKSYHGTLPDTDSTIVAGVLQTKDWDMPYEEGSVGFVYRALQEYRVWYYE
jgi:hypothetical protein